MVVYDLRISDSFAYREIKVEISVYLIMEIIDQSLQSDCIVGRECDSYCWSAALTFRGRWPFFLLIVITVMSYTQVNGCRRLPHVESGFRAGLESEGQAPGDVPP